MRVSRTEFERIVRQTVEQLPAHLREAIQNVEIEVRLEPTAEDYAYSAEEYGDAQDEPGDGEGEQEELFGLYRGIPLTERGSSYDLVLPDLITIFQRPHEEVCQTMAELREEVAITVRHEIAHYFGISDERLDELGAY